MEGRARRAAARRSGRWRAGTTKAAGARHGSVQWNKRARDGAHNVPKGTVGASRKLQWAQRKAWGPLSGDAATDEVRLAPGTEVAKATKQNAEPAGRRNPATGWGRDPPKAPGAGAPQPTSWARHGPAMGAKGSARTRELWPRGQLRSARESPKRPGAPERGEGTSVHAGARSSCRNERAMVGDTLGAQRAGKQPRRP